MTRGTDTDHQVLVPPESPGPHAPAGVPPERVDPATLQAVHQLFPSPCSGLEFLALLLRLAIAKQMALAEMGVADVAEISVQSIRKLAALIGWSYDATHKYVVLFCSLGLLVKSRENGLVKLRFPLCRYQPPTSLQKLDRLIAEARPKVVSFAKRVKRRFLLLYGAPLPKPDTPHIEMPPAELSYTGEIQAAIRDLKETMALPEALPLRARLAQILAKLEKSPDLPDQGEQDGRLDISSAASEGAALQTGRLAEKKSPIQPLVFAQNGRLSGRMGDSPDLALPQNGRLATEMGDSDAAAGNSKGRLFQQMGDSPILTQPQNGRLAAETGDSPGAAGNEKSPVLPSESPEKGGLSAEKVDFSPEMVDSGAADASNVNVSITNILEKFNVNVRGATDAVIGYLMGWFGEHRGKLGYWRGLVKICGESSIWLAATVETCVAMQRQTDPVRDPGRYFYNRVCAMAKGGIPFETAQLVKRYGCLSFVQLQTVLSAAGQSSQVSRPAPPPGRPRPPAVKIDLRIPRDRRAAGMSLDEAKLLQQEIREHPDLGAWLTQAYWQEDGSCALLVESPIRRQAWLYRRAAWFETLKPLFPSPTANMIKSTSRKYH